LIENRSIVQYFRLLSGQYFLFFLNRIITIINNITYCTMLYLRRLYYGCVIGKWVSWLNRFLFKAEKNTVRSFVRQNKDENKNIP